MASREEQKRKAREERERKEREEQETKSKRKKRILILGGAALVVIIAIVAVVVITSSSKKKTIAGQTPGPGKGIQTSPGPWPPSYDNFPERLKQLALPDTSDQIFHIHANLVVYTDGKKQKVPAQIGIDQKDQLL